MFNKAPMVSPASKAIFSVASVNSADRGTIANELVAKTHAGGVLHKYVANPTGTNINRRLIYEENKANFMLESRPSKRESFEER